MSPRPDAVDEPRRDIELRRDASGFIVSAAGDLERLLGWREDQLVGSPSTSFIHPQDQPSAVTAWMEMIEHPGRPFTWRGRYRRANGDWAWVETVNTNKLEDPEFGVVLSLMYEIPAGQLSIEEQLRAREELLFQLADALPVGIVQFGVDRSINFVNDRLHAILDQRDAVDIDELFTAVVVDDRSTLDHAIESALREQPVDGCEVRLDDADDPGSGVICSLSMRPLTDANSTVNGAVATVDDITDQARLRRQLEHQAMTDELTSCANRRAILETLDEALRSQRDSADGIAIAFIDLDDFKHVNDTYGHSVGDEILVTTAHRLRQVLRTIDRVGRLGGDEFLVVSPDVADAGAASQITERINAAINCDVSIDGHTIAVRASVGTAFTNEQLDPDELIASADRSMYGVKGTKATPGARR